MTSSSGMKFVYDSYALLAYFQGEQGSAQIAQVLFEDANVGLISTINVGEVFYIAAKRTDITTAENVLKDVYDLPLLFIHPDYRMVMEAAQIKALHSLSYADCFAAALARRYAATVVTGDREFEQVADIVRVE
jgi:ribonuclease VapC